MNNGMNTDRRAFLAVAPALALLTAGPAAALAIPAADRSAWNAAMDAYRRASEAYEGFKPIHDRAHAAWLAGRPSMDSIPWQEFYGRGDIHHIARVMDLDKAWADFLRQEGKTWFAPNKAAADKAKARHRVALDAIQAFRDAEAQHSRDTGFDAASERIDALCNAEDDAETLLMQMPAPDLPALGWKLERIFVLDPDGSMSPWTLAYVGQTIADFRRLLGEAR